MGFTAVVLRVEYTGSNDLGAGELREEEALFQLFAETGAVQIKSDSDVRYQASDYDEFFWYWHGQLTMLRRRDATTFKRVPGKGYRRDRKAGEESFMSGDSSIEFVYSPSDHLIVVQEGPDLAYTRFLSYVRHAINAPENQEYGIRLRLVPEQFESSAWGLFSEFDRVEHVSVVYEHSNSPGKKSVDAFIEALGLEKASETVEAPSGLDVERLTSGSKDPVRQVQALKDRIEHINRNKDNGVVSVRGQLDGETQVLSTRTAVRKQRGERREDERSYATALARIIRGFERD